MFILVMHLWAGVHELGSRVAGSNVPWIPPGGFLHSRVQMDCANLNSQLGAQTFLAAASRGMFAGVGCRGAVV